MEEIGQMTASSSAENNPMVSGEANDVSGEADDDQQHPFSSTNGNLLEGDLLDMVSYSNDVPAAAFIADNPPVTEIKNEGDVVDLLGLASSSNITSTSLLTETLPSSTITTDTAPIPPDPRTTTTTANGEIKPESFAVTDKEKNGDSQTFIQQELPTACVPEKEGNNDEGKMSDTTMTTKTMQTVNNGNEPSSRLESTSESQSTVPSDCDPAADDEKLVSDRQNDDDKSATTSSPPGGEDIIASETKTSNCDAVEHKSANAQPSMEITQEQPKQQSPPQPQHQQEATTTTSAEEKPTKNGDSSEQKSFLVLISSKSLDQQVTTRQQKAFTVLDAKNIPYEVVDGADPSKNILRDELFNVSGRRLEYPQFFFVHLPGGSATFWGDWDRFECANEDGTLACKLLGEETPTDNTTPPGDDSVLMELQTNLQQQMALKAEAQNKVRLATDTIKQLQDKVQKQQDEIERFQDLGSNLQQQMSAKAEAENKVRLMDAKVAELEKTSKEQAEKIAEFEELQSNLQKQMSAKAEAENNYRLEKQRAGDLEQKNKDKEVEIENSLSQNLKLKEEMETVCQELENIRLERDEQHRKEMALTNRLNAAKKTEADKANLAEEYEEDIESIREELENTKQELSELQASKKDLDQEMQQLKDTAKERLRQLETSLADERKVSGERKRKMKIFVENKSEELRQAKSDNESLQTELNQTNRSLLDLNQRWKQLHEQWVQSQTRNRELQRELNKIKKDSENLHKVRDTQNSRLSRSANETEEHKNKRLAAKHELMTALRILETERGISAKLCDSMKFTFVPKALSQQQLLKESLEQFETELVKLSQRVRLPLPAVAAEDSAHLDLSERSEEDISDSNGDADDNKSGRLISKLEHETQRVSQCIMLLQADIDRMRQLLKAGENRSCYTALSEILTTGTMGALTDPSHSVQGETASLSRGPTN